MHPFILTGLVWFVLLYVVSAVLFKRAQEQLSVSEQEILRQLRRYVFPLPFLFLGAGISVAYWRITALWVFLLSTSLVFPLLANWHFRRGGLPSTYTDTYLRGTIFWAMGVAGFAIAIGATFGFSL